MDRNTQLLKVFDMMLDAAQEALARGDGLLYQKAILRAARIRDEISKSLKQEHNNPNPA